PVPHPPQLPPLPRLPPMPSIPFLEASACPYSMWTMPEHKCYWRVLSPD
nr:plant specific eukaryotic initiation factor 4B [Tanacetum cinerariifolium]